MSFVVGQDLFGGTIEHSHNFRNPEKFKGKRVLVIGAGPSGLDLTLHISSVAEYVSRRYKIVISLHNCQCHLKQ